MTANFLKYITVRMASAFSAFLIVGYISMHILYEQMGGEKYNPFLWIIIALLSLFIPSVFLSYIGKLRFNGFLIKAGEYDLPHHSRKAAKRFERLLQFASSFYFFPTTTEKLLKQIYREYSKLFLGLHARSKAAQEVYEKTISRYPGDSNLQNILLHIYAEKENLSKKELGVCSFIFKHSSDKRQVIEILSKYYLEKDVFDFDSQEIFTKAIRLNTPSKEKVVDFLILKLIELQREDDFAAEVYLTAYSDYSNNSEAVIEAIIKLALDRKKKDSTEGISQKLFNIYEKIPENTRKQIEKRVLRTQQEKETTLSAKKNPVNELISKLLQKTSDIIKYSRNSLKNKILKFQTIRFPQESLFKKHLFIIFSSISLAAVLLITIIVLQGRENKKPPINFLNANPKYTIYESKLPYSIQVAAFKTLSKAEKVINNLSEEGEKAYYTKTSGKTVWYRARVGEFKTKREAKRYAEKLLKRKLIKGYFISDFEPGFIKIEEEKK